MKTMSSWSGLLILSVITAVTLTGCTTSPATIEPVGPITRLPSEMVLKITDLEGEGWTVVESVPVSEHGAEYAYQVAFSKETSAGSPAAKEMVSCKIALYYHEGEARERFLAEIKSEVPTVELKFGDEAFLDTRPVINGKALTFRQDNVVVWIWMNYDGDIESLARVVEQRID